MPRMQASPKEAADRVAKSCICANMHLYGKEEEELAIKARVTKRTFNERMKKPGTFTLDELRELCKALKLTPVQMASILAGRVLTAADFKELILPPISKAN